MQRPTITFLQQIVTVGTLTLCSRILGFVRELCFVRTVGARILSDAFLTALRIPNMLYEICIGGACGPAVLPTMVQLKRAHGMAQLSGCITATILLSGVTMLCAAGTISYHAETLVRLLAPGFGHEQVTYTVVLLPILSLFMVTTAITAIIAEALRALQHIVVPAAGQIVINSTFIGGLWWYSYEGQLNLRALAWCIIIGSCLQLIMHIIAAYYAGIRITAPDAHAWRGVRTIMTQMIPCMITAGIQELALFIELQFASYLPAGSVSLLSYASSFVRLPFGIFVHAIVSVLLPDATHAQQYSPRRVEFLIAEALKCIGWIIIPISLGLMCCAYDIFATLYWSPQFSHASVITAARLLTIKASALLCLASNHVLIQLLYVRQKTTLPTLVSLISTAGNILLNIILTKMYGLYGIAVAGIITTCIRTCLFSLLAHTQGNIISYAPRIFTSWARTILQTACCLGPCLLGSILIRAALRLNGYIWLADRLSLWLWLAPLYAGGALAMYYTRHQFGITLYLLDHRKTRTQRGVSL